MGRAVPGPGGCAPVTSLGGAFHVQSGDGTRRGARRSREDDVEAAGRRGRSLAARAHMSVQSSPVLSYYPTSPNMCDGRAPPGLADFLWRAFGSFFLANNKRGTYNNTSGYG